jgi:hypothetical protein
VRNSKRLETEMISFKYISDAVMVYNIQIESISQLTLISLLFVIEFSLIKSR